MNLNPTGDCNLSLGRSSLPSLEVPYSPDYSSVTFQPVSMASVDDDGFRESIWIKNLPNAAKDSGPIKKKNMA